MVEQSVGLLPARMSQRPVALCPGPHRVSCSWHQPPHRAGKHNSYTGPGGHGVGASARVGFPVELEWSQKNFIMVDPDPGGTW